MATTAFVGERSCAARRDEALTRPRAAEQEVNEVNVMHRSWTGTIRSLTLGSLVIAGCSKEASPTPEPKASEPKASEAQGLDAKETARAAQALAGADPVSVAHANFSTQLWGTDGGQPCAELDPTVLYHGVTGIDQCPRPMTDQEKAALNDPWARVLLRPNTPFPAGFDDIVNDATSVHADLARHTVLLGEGAQLPDAPDHDVRFIVTWGDAAFESASLFFSARPSPAAHTLEVIAFDETAQKLDFYHYTGATDDSTQKSWVYAGDSNDARNPAARAKGCFACHLNGTMNMKELALPWNNWNSFKAQISESMLPKAVQGDPLVNQLYAERKGAEDFEGIIRSLNVAITKRWVNDTTQGGQLDVVALEALLTPLFKNTTINLASADAQTGDPKLPNDVLLFDTALRDPAAANLQYGPGGGQRDLEDPTNLAVSIPRSIYDLFVLDLELQFVDRDEKYEHAGDTFFPLMVPTPAYEDSVAIAALVTNGVISPKLAAAVLMVDFQNPVFSEPRAMLLQREYLAPGPYTLDGRQIPEYFVSQAQIRTGGVACDPTKATNCSPEQQLMHWWSMPDNGWKPAMEAAISSYLDGTRQRLQQQQIALNVFQVALSLRTQFAHKDDICNLDEFPLLLPNSIQGNLSVRLEYDGTMTPKVTYTGCSSDPG